MKIMQPDGVLILTKRKAPIFTLYLFSLCIYITDLMPEAFSSSQAVGDIEQFMVIVYLSITRQRARRKYIYTQKSTIKYK